jgi:hypothetical protein
MTNTPPKDNPDPTLPIAMGIFAAFVIVTLFGMLMTSSQVVLRPTLDPAAATTVSKP